MIDEAIAAGARQHKACKVVGLSVRTIQNWRKRPGQGDLRKGPKRPPAHKITAEERAAVLSELNKPEHADICLGQLVAHSVDQSLSNVWWQRVNAVEMNAKRCPLKITLNPE